MLLKCRETPGESPLLNRRQERLQSNLCPLCQASQQKRKGGEVIGCWGVGGDNQVFMWRGADRGAAWVLSTCPPLLSHAGLIVPARTHKNQLMLMHVRPPPPREPTDVHFLSSLKVCYLMAKVDIQIIHVTDPGCITRPKLRCWR